MSGGGDYVERNIILSSKIAIRELVSQINISFQQGTLSATSSPIIGKAFSKIYNVHLIE